METRETQFPGRLDPSERHRLPRRTSFSFGVVARRGADYTARASCFRIACVAALAATLLAGDGSWWAWVIVGIGLVGSLLALGISRSEVFGSQPRSRYVERAWRATMESHSVQRANPSGVLETVAVVLAPAVGIWGIDATEWRVSSLAVAAIWLASVASNIFLDPAFYNPSETDISLVEMIRGHAGPVLAVGLLVPTVLAHWPNGESRFLAVLACLPALAVGTRIRETDRALAFANLQAKKSEMAGRDLVLAQVHSSLTGSLAVAVKLARQHSDQDSDLYDELKIARARLQQLMALEDAGVSEWRSPSTLGRPIRWITRPYGTRTVTSINAAHLKDRDHDIALLVIGDLVSNAVHADASEIKVLIEDRNELIVIAVADDVGNFPSATWHAEGTSLGRLRRVLQQRGGGLQLETNAGGSTITASWVREVV